jgi:uncharacterized damage-inducible protein DinB
MAARTFLSRMSFEDVWTLLDYHYWARDRMFDALEVLTPQQFTRDLGNSFGSVRDTVVHIYFAEWVWYSRWTGHSPTSFPSATDFPEPAAIRAPWKSQEQKVRLFVGGLGPPGLERVVDYKLFNGQPSKSVFWHTLQHVVNHGTYHRGQVTTMLRQLGALPPKSQDLITFYRERASH